MGWHDRLAQAAASRGTTAAQFHHSAQQYANATWLWLVVGAVVWYLSAWTWALIPAGLAVMSIAKSASATMIAGRLELLTGRQG